MVNFDPRLLILCLLGGFLFATALIKISAKKRDKLVWPEGPNLLRLHVPLWLVLLSEILAGASPLVLRSQLSATLLAAVYLAVTIGAITLHGRDCACFGIDGLKVGWWHVSGCAVATIAAGAIAVAPPAASGVLQALIPWALFMAASVAILVAVAMAVKRRVETSATGCLSSAVELHILTIPDCGACAGLKLLCMSKTRPGIVWWTVGEDQLPEAIVDIAARVQYPSAVAINASGYAACPAQEGLPRCQKLIEDFRTRVRL